MRAQIAFYTGESGDPAGALALYRVAPPTGSTLWAHDTGRH